MPRPKGPSKTQVSVRLEDEVLERIQAVAAAAAPPGLRLTTADVIQMCIATTLPQLEAQHVKAKAKKSK